MTTIEYLLEVSKLAYEKAKENVERYEMDAVSLTRQAYEAKHKRDQHLFQIANLKALTQLRYNQLMKSLKKKGGVDPEIARVMELKYEEVNKCKS